MINKIYKKTTPFLLFSVLIMFSCTQKTFTVTWKNYDDTILEIDKNVKFGTMPIYNGPTPTQTPTKNLHYIFDGWDNETAPIKSNVTFKAKFKSSKHNYCLKKIITNEEESLTNPGIFYCKDCKNETKSNIKHSDISVPILNLNGDFSKISHDEKIKINLSYESSDICFDSDATIKWQGASSLNYPKKNYSIHFFEKDTSFETEKKIKFNSEWGEQSKYCLKANYKDYTFSQNTCNGKMWGNIVKSRKNESELKNLPNGGAQDGFPILLYKNNIYEGIYVLTIPKDKWLFKMKKNEKQRQAIICSTNNTSKKCKLLEKINNNFNSGIELEFSSTKNTNWIVDSWNNMIEFINSNDGEQFKNHIEKYIDINALIDCYLFNCLIAGYDNFCNNMLYVTYDGIKWIPSLYDLDLSFTKTEYFPSFDDANSREFTILNKRISDNYQKELSSRWKELRSSILTLENFDDIYNIFYFNLNGMLFDSDEEKWEYKKRQSARQLNSITNCIRINLAFLDKKFSYEQKQKNYFTAYFDTTQKELYLTYRNKNILQKGDSFSTVYSRNISSGKITSINGDICFKVLNNNIKYKISGNFDKLETPVETKKENLYIIKNVKSNLKIELCI